MARTRTSGTVLLAALLATGAAREDGDCEVPMDRWQPRAAVEALAQRQGWTLRRIGLDDGCYVVRGQDAGGRALVLRLDPASLRPVTEDDDEIMEKED